MLEGIATGAIRFYQQHLSKRKCPHGTKLGEEHCSDYGIRTISEEGLIKGGLRTIARIVSCFRRDANSYVDNGQTLAELARLAVDAYRFNRIRAVRGGTIAIEMRDISNFFYKSNWSKTKTNGFFDVLCCLDENEINDKKCFLDDDDTCY